MKVSVDHGMLSHCITVWGASSSLCVLDTHIQQCKCLRLGIVMQRTVISLQAICGCIFRPGVDNTPLNSSHVREITTVNESASPAFSLNGSSC